jgi:hypothetical protein
LKAPWGLRCMSRRSREPYSGAHTPPPFSVEIPPSTQAWFRRYSWAHDCGLASSWEQASSCERSATPLGRTWSSSFHSWALTLEGARQSRSIEMRVAIAPLVVIAVVAGVAACGEEAVDLGAPGASGDSGAAEGQALDGASSCTPGAGQTCTPDGALCTVQGDCCSNRCEGGFCITSGTCTAPGTKCATRSTCCSGRCEPAGGDRICLGYCAVDGAACDVAQDCCSLACHAHVCGGQICGVTGSSCKENDECCSSSCNNGFCGLDSSTTCNATGEACSSDAGLGCCSGVCNQESMRCDLGPGACRQPGTPCVVDGDCCRGSCAPGSSGVAVCASQCLADGANCNSAGDCCGRVCSGSPAKCGGVTCADQ